MENYKNLIEKDNNETLNNQKIKKIFDEIDGDKYKAKALINVFLKNEINSNILKSMKTVMEQKIGKIRKSKSREELSQPQNALILQMYSIIFLNKTEEEIKGIDGKFGLKTVNILRICQKSGIGFENTSKFIANNNLKEQLSLLNINILEEYFFLNLKEELEEKFGENFTINEIGKINSDKFITYEGDLDTINKYELNFSKELKIKYTNGNVTVKNFGIDLNGNCLGGNFIFNEKGKKEKVINVKDKGNIHFDNILIMYERIKNKNITFDDEFNFKGGKVEYYKLI